MTYKEVIRQLRLIHSDVYWDEEKEALRIAIDTLTDVIDDKLVEVIYCRYCDKAMPYLSSSYHYDRKKNKIIHIYECPHCHRTWEEEEEG